MLIRREGRAVLPSPVEVVTVTHGTGTGFLAPTHCLMPFWGSSESPLVAEVIRLTELTVATCEHDDLKN